MVNVLEHLAQRGLLVQTAGQWELRAEDTTTTVDIPEQLQSVVLRRIEALPAAT